MTGTRLTDERLCWLAVRDHLDGKASRLGFFGTLRRIFGGFGGRRIQIDTAGGRAREVPSLQRSADGFATERSERMMDYGLAVDDCARKLSADERQVLRSTGRVPEWFLTAVEERYAEIRKAG